MDKWKSFFESSGSDIWTVIDRAITLAAVEQPAEMRLRRDKYTEKMFCPTSHLTGLCECDGGEAGNENETNLGRSEDEEDEEDDEDDDVSENKFVVVPAKVDRGDEVDEDEEDEDERRGRRRRRMDLSDEEEEESPQIREVNRLKSRISNADEDDEYLCDALETLDRMQISVPTLKATVIGLPVNKLRKHSSSKVRAIAQRLISRWKALTDKHLTSKPVSSHFDNNDDDYGLPSPPVDEGELLAAGNAPVEVTKLFDFFEDEMSDGSDMNEQPRRGSSGDWVNGIYEDAHSPQNNVTTNKPSRKTTDSEADRHNKPSSKKDTIKSSDSLRNKSGEGRLEKPSSRANGKLGDDLKDSRKTVTTSSSRPKPATAAAAAASTVARGAPPPKAKPAAANGFQKRGDDKAQQNTKVSQTKNQPDGLRLAAAKRKLHEEYRQAENAKKQRTVQVMELTDLPKGKGGPKAVKAGPTKSHVQHNNRYRR